jgi:hypothetical protein
MSDAYEEFEDLIRNGNLEAAEKRVFAWIRDHPADSRAWVLYGKTVADRSQQRDCFRRALALDPSNSEAESLLHQFNPAVSPGAGPLTETRGSLPTPVPPRKNITPPSYSPGRISPESAGKTGINCGFMVYSLIHFLLTVLLCVAMVFVVSSAVPGLIRQNVPTANAARSWISDQTPADSNDPLQSLAYIFPNPSVLDYRNVSEYKDLKLLGNSISGASSASEQIPVKGARFIGRLAGGSVLQSGKKGQPLVIKLEVNFGGNRIPVVYYGPAGGFQNGDTLLIEGVYITEVHGVAAQLVRDLSMRAAPSLSEDDTMLLRTAGIVLLWALLCVSFFIWRLNLRRWRNAKASPVAPVAMLISIVILAFSLTGCSINISTTLRTDGTGTTTILVQESRENMDFLRSAPGISGYLSAMVRDLKALGVMFDQYIEGDQEFTLLQQNVSNASGGAGDAFPLEGSWTAVQQYTEGNEDVLRFLCVVDTRTLYADSPGLSPDAARTLREQLDQVTMTYDLYMPGRIVYHNGDERTNQRVTWQLRMNESNYLVAETRLPAAKKGALLFENPYLWIAIVLVFLVATLLLIASFRVRASSEKRGEKP